MAIPVRCSAYLHIKIAHMRAPVITAARTRPYQDASPLVSEMYHKYLLQLSLKYILTS